VLITHPFLLGDIMSRRKITRRQLRRMLLHEVRVLANQQYSNRRQLNEGPILTTLAYLGLGALTTLGILVAYARPGLDVGDGTETYDPNAMNRYHGIEDALEDIGQEVKSGKSPQQAVTSGLKKNASAAQKISAVSKQNGGKTVTAAVGPFPLPVGGKSQSSAEYDPEEQDLQSGKYGSQDPTQAGYKGLGLPFPFGGGDDDFFSPGDDEGDGFG
jgi:hypothetical protein